MIWDQLERAAASDNLRLHRTRGGVTIITTDGMPCSLLHITIGELTDEDGDVVLRMTLAAALRALKDLPR